MNFYIQNYALKLNLGVIIYTKIILTFKNSNLITPKKKNKLN